MKKRFQNLSNVNKGLLLLTISSLLFASMGVFIRLASQTVDNTSVVFFRNFVALCWLLPFFMLKKDISMKTEKPWMHIWRSVIGLLAMYGFFYAIAHMPLSNAMVFTYSSPVFIPLIAWLFLKEAMTTRMWVSAALGLVGVVLVAKPSGGIFNFLSLVGITASFCAGFAFVTVRALTQTEPVTRIVLYFAMIGAGISAIPVLLNYKNIMNMLTPQALLYLFIAGSLATFSQFCMSKAYSYAPAGSIGPANYMAIIFAGVWGYLLWGELPDVYGMLGILIIFVAILICMPNFLVTLKNLFDNQKGEKEKNM